MKPFVFVTPGPGPQCSGWVCWEGQHVHVQGGWAAPVLLQLAASPGEGGLGLDISGQSWVDNIIIIIIVLVVVMNFYNLLISINPISMNTVVILNIGASSSESS